MLKIALTGGIGSGKSSVCQLFAEFNTPIIDADNIAHQQAQPGAIAYQEIVSYFGASALNTDKTLNRSYLKQRIFNNAAEKHQLESITHPLIFDAIINWCQQQTAAYCICAVPLLFETAQSTLFERVLLVDCSVTIQIERVCARDQLSKQTAERIIQQQATREQRLSIADDVLLNNGSYQTLVKDVKKLHNHYLSLSRSSG